MSDTRIQDLVRERDEAKNRALALEEQIAALQEFHTTSVAAEAPVKDLRKSLESLIEDTEWGETEDPCFKALDRLHTRLNDLLKEH